MINRNIYFIVLTGLVFISCNNTKKSNQESTTVQQEVTQEEKPVRGLMNKKADAIISAQPYNGIFTSKGKQEGLFPIKST